jgi:hypothetical protein
MKPECFGSLNCSEDYECPLFEACGKAFFDELESVPLEVWHIIQKQLVENKAKISWEVRTKK